MNCLNKTLVLGLSLCIMLNLSPASAFAFDLFNQDRGKVPEPPPPPPQPPAPPPPVPVPPVPVPPPPPQRDYGLQGTSQLGKQFRVVLLTPLNQVLKVGWQSGGKPLELGEGFRLLQVEARQAIIEYPAISPCHEDRWDRGVDCSADGKTATLSLVLGKPTPVQVAVRAQPVAPAPVAAANPNAEPVDDQSEAARERAREMFQNAMQRNNIAPNEVPPGMRVVKTPFGDRLVPDKK